MQRARIWERLPRMLCAYGIMGLPAILLWMFRISEKESGGVPKTKHTARNNARRSQPYRSASSTMVGRSPLMVSALMRIVSAWMSSSPHPSVPCASI